MRYVQFSLLFLFLSHAAYATESTVLQGLSDAEKDYYRQAFLYTVNAIKAGETYDWKSYSGGGTIKVGPPYTSKSGSYCRSFSESYVVNKKAGSEAGIACRREGKPGWCKLREKAEALTCAFEPPENIMEEGELEVGDAVEKSKGLWGRVKGIWR